MTHEATATLETLPLISAEGEDFVEEFFSAFWLTATIRAAALVSCDVCSQRAIGVGGVGVPKIFAHFSISVSRESNADFEISTFAHF